MLPVLIQQPTYRPNEALIERIALDIAIYPQ